jgi:ATP-dependent DNA ligase
MPSKTKKQQHLMGAALAVKRGESKGFPEARKVASGMTQKQLEDFARKAKGKKK